jgi:hypothetical protein
MARKSKKKDAANWPEVSLAQNPKAKSSIAKLKAGTGLVVFAAVAYLSYAAGVAPFEVVARALVAGIASYLAAWAVGIALWKRLLIHEAKMAVERRRAQLLAQIEAAAGDGDGASEREAAA